MTASQKALLVKVVRRHRAGGPAYRAESAGERVTLASLYRRGYLARDAWRGAEGEADAAFEYRPSSAVLEALQRPRLRPPS